jgi:hypothetical protein
MDRLEGEHEWRVVGEWGPLLIYACTSCPATRIGFRLLGCEGGCEYTPPHDRQTANRD